ncbi:unnamed protein product [Orchesella dallaii]|uniref:Uncharacterized protein n=1 Tax=Orchesella dallaii TaxID=48710 RepID=A0ABP1PZG9_9HEXA
MNWIGGSLARLKAQQMLNRERFPNRVRVRHNEGEPRTEENSDGEIDEETDNGILEDNEDHLNQQQRSRRASRKKNHAEPDAESKRELDYAALGYELVAPSPVQRRVVPLLEFIEKEFPHGHVVSLQLSHQMDIAATPMSIPSSETRRPIGNCPSGTTSPYSPSQTSEASSRRTTPHENSTVGNDRTLFSHLSSSSSSTII